MRPVRPPLLCRFTRRELPALKSVQSAKSGGRGARRGTFRRLSLADGARARDAPRPRPTRGAAVGRVARECRQRPFRARSLVKLATNSSVALFRPELVLGLLLV